MASAGSTKNCAQCKIQLAFSTKKKLLSYTVSCLAKIHARYNFDVSDSSTFSGSNTHFSAQNIFFLLINDLERNSKKKKFSDKIKYVYNPM